MSVRSYAISTRYPYTCYITHEAARIMLNDSGVTHLPIVSYYVRDSLRILVALLNIKDSLYNTVHSKLGLKIYLTYVTLDAI